MGSKQPGPVNQPTVGANPTAKVGTAAVNGTATTFLRSDGAPPIDQAMTPTMSGLWTFNVGAIAAVFTPSIDLVNSTASTSLVTQQFSPSIILTGHGWTGSVDAEVDFRETVVPGTTRAASKLTFSGQYNNLGYIDVLQLGADRQTTVVGNLVVQDTDSHGNTITGNLASSFTTTAGAVTIDAGTSVLIGPTTATLVALGRSGQTVTITCATFTTTANVIQNASMAQMAAYTVKSNLTGTTANQADNPVGSFALRDMGINGAFAIWQSLGTAPGTVLGTTNDIYIGPDMWKGNNVSKSGPAWTPAQATATPNFAPTYLTLTNASGSSDKVAIWQPMESWVSQYLSNAGIPVTITFYAKISSITGSPGLNFGLLEWSGTADGLGGNSTGNTYSGWSTTTGTDPTFSASYAMKGKQGPAALTTSFQKFTATITPDASKNNLLPYIWLDTAVANGVVLTIADFSIVPNAPVPVPDATYLSVYRYLWTIPVPSGSPHIVGTVGGTNGVNDLDFRFSFPVTMRTAPVLFNNISGWNGAEPTTTLIGAVTYSTGGFVTITGALTVSAVALTPNAATFRAVAATSFSATAGVACDLRFGPTVLAGFDARL